jgi:GMP synthase-like glutamine amidotransferase
MEEYRDRFEDYPSMIQSLFVQIDPSINFTFYDVVAGIYPENINECDGYIITGSKKSVYDQIAWINDLQNFIVHLNESKKMLVGICFGHQLVAQAFGGKTEKSEKGWGVGVHTCRIYEQKSWMTPQLESCNSIVCHQDQVTVLPEGAELIAGNTFCPHSMFQLGEHILTIQGHPEFNKQYAETMMHHRVKLIDETSFNEGITSFKKQTHERHIAEWIINFLSKDI